MSVKYLVVTPAKNEEEFIRETLDSVCCQEILPTKFIILNDNSTDRTEEIAREYEKSHPWIIVENTRDLKIDDKGARIATLINYIVQKYYNKEFDFICKLDADVRFNKSFYKKLFQYFFDNTKLGIASGRLIYEGIKEVVVHKEHTRGATKIYKRECWDHIGGVYETTGWDTLDDFSAMSKNWETKSLPVFF